MIDVNKSKTKLHENWRHYLDLAAGSAREALGLANIWRFPYFCFIKGGGTYLCPFKSNYGQSFIALSSPLESLIRFEARTLLFDCLSQLNQKSIYYTNNDLFSRILGPFLMAYLILLVVVGVPMICIEMAAGRATHSGPIQAIGKLAPLVKGS